MKCEKCGNEFAIQIATKVNCKGCKLATGMTTVMTIQCEKCGHITQTPVQIVNVFSIDERK